ncbi:predicted protein [Plenodomus lingam JN3]|uniref:Predicted protein n=1 Tax=Leptosphaeria maculans (strain JN3 / isolate v23.1.3 / race Av1-4-5-6-7-8) TaxID=985895 RepID=E4ZUX0_LEPMJ|nr:predicted protein [Plenodomus lingam JN3]CBX94907.1 predicted protein [Plenodomus lingam JN3]
MLSWVRYSLTSLGTQQDTIPLRSGPESRDYIDASERLSTNYISCAVDGAAAEEIDNVAGDTVSRNCSGGVGAGLVVVDADGDLREGTGDSSDASGQGQDGGCKAGLNCIVVF